MSRRVSLMTTPLKPPNSTATASYEKCSPGNGMETDHHLGYRIRIMDGYKSQEPFPGNAHQTNDLHTFDGLPPSSPVTETVAS